MSSDNLRPLSGIAGLRHVPLTLQPQLVVEPESRSEQKTAQVTPGPELARYRLAVPDLGDLRAAAFDAERAIRERDVAEAIARVGRVARKFETVRGEYQAFRWLFGSALAELKKRLESPGFRGFRQAAAPSIAAIIALLGPRFMGREIVAQYGGPCAVCGDPCPKGTLVVYDDATKKGAHMTCGELAK